MGPAIAGLHPIRDGLNGRPAVIVAGIFHTVRHAQRSVPADGVGGFVDDVPKVDRAGKALHVFHDAGLEERGRGVRRQIAQPGGHAGDVCPCERMAFTQDTLTACPAGDAQIALPLGTTGDRLVAVPIKRKDGEVEELLESLLEKRRLLGREVLLVEQLKKNRAEAELVRALLDHHGHPCDRLAGGIDNAEVNVALPVLHDILLGLSEDRRRLIGGGGKGRRAGGEANRQKRHEFGVHGWLQNTRAGVTAGRDGK